jgi:ABC-2 type transport system ATP-binding protein
MNAETEVHFTTSNGFQPEQLKDVAGVTAVTQQEQQVTVRGSGPLLAKVATALAQYNIAPADLSVHQANLEDVFLSLTRRRIRA